MPVPSLLLQLLFHIPVLKSSGAGSTLLLAPFLLKINLVASNGKIEVEREFIYNLRPTPFYTPLPPVQNSHSQVIKSETIYLTR